MPNTVDDIMKKYEADPISSAPQEGKDAPSAQSILTRRSNDFQTMIQEKTNARINPTKTVMREGVNLAGPEHGGLNYERYYNRGAFKELGFNPYKDNEKIYNEKTTPWQDLNEAWEQAINLRDLGFTSIFGGKSDRQEAEAYSRYSNIGSTSRGGVFGTMTNAMLNSGYTIGLLSEIAAEEVLMAIGAAATGFTETPLMIARTAKNAERLSKVGKVADMAGTYTNLVKRMQGLKNAATAKSFYKASKEILKAANPLRGGTEYLTAQRALDAEDGLSALAQTGKTFGAFYRDVREITLAYDEAQLESGFVSNGIKNDLINEHIHPKDGMPGEFPTSAEMFKINKEAKTASDNAKFVNTGLIYATNRIAFGNLFNKWMPAKLRGSAADIAGYKLVKNFKTNKMDAIKQGGILNLKGAWEGTKYSFKHLNQLPLRAVKTVGKYSRTNVGEGIQEYFQEVIQDAETTMAKDRYAGNVAGGAWYTALHSDDYFNQYSKSLDKYVSEEGFEVFKGGFVMGMFAGPFGRGSQAITQAIDKHGRRLYDKEGYLKDNKVNPKTGRTDAQEKFHVELDALNDMTDSKKDFIFDLIDMLQRQTQYAAKMDEAIASGDIKSFVTEKDHALVRQILDAQRMGAEDLIISKLKDMSTLSEEDLNDAFGEVDADGQPRKSDELVAGYKESSEKLIKRAEGILRFSKDYDKMFPKPVGAGIQDSDFGDTRNQKSYLNYAWREAKILAITHQQDLVRSMERAASILDKSYIKQPFWNKNKMVPAAEITRIFNTANTVDELEILDDEIAVLEGIPPAELSGKDKKKLIYKTELQKLLKEFVAPKGPLKIYIKALQQQAFHVNRAKQIEDAGDLEVGSTMRFSNRESSWGGEIVGEGENSKGQPIWKVKKETNGNVVPILKSSPRIVTDVADVEGADNTLDEATNELKALYKSYLETVGDYHGNPLNETQFQESFDDFADFFALNEDSKNLSWVINRITNPEAQLALIERFEKLRRDKFENMQETVKEQLELYSKSVWLKKLVESLAKFHNVYIHEDELLALDQQNHIPEMYFHVETNEPLRKNTPSYEAVIDAVETAMIEEDLLEPKAIKGHSVRKEDSGKFSVISPKGIVIKTDIDTEEEAEEIKIDLDTILGEKKEEKKSEAPVEKPTKKAKAVSFDTPFEELPDSVIKAAKKSLSNYNEAQVEAGGTQIKDVESYLADDVSRQSVLIKDAIAKHNGPTEEAPVVEEEEIEVEVEVEEKPKKTGSAFPIAEAHPSELSPTLEDKVFSGKVTMLSLTTGVEDKATGVNNFESIFKPTRDGKTFTKNDTVKDIPIGHVFVISREAEAGRKEYVQLTYEGHKLFSEVKITDPLNQLDLKETRDEGDAGPYKWAVVINENTYFASSSAIPLWIEKGSTKLQIFTVSAPFEKAGSTPSKDSSEAWEKSIEARFNNSTNLKATKAQVISDNVTRKGEKRPSVLPEVITRLYNEALGKNKENFTAEDVQLLDHYNVGPVQIENKIVNFGTAKVIAITATGVTIESTGVSTAGQTKDINAKDMKEVLQSKIVKGTDIEADVIDQLPEEEKAAVEKSIKSVEKFTKDAASIKSVKSKVKSKSTADVKADFKKKLGC